MPIFMISLAFILSCGTGGCVPRPSPPLSDQEAVLLYYDGPATKVCVRGSFNAWAPDQDCLRFTGQRWELALRLPPGRHTYVFWLDDHRALPDPAALLQEDDGFGGRNAVLFVP